MQVIGLDHLVILSADVERSLSWYIDRLGLEPVRVEEWRRGEVFFPSVRVSPEVILDLLAAPPDGRNIDHFCLVVAPCDLEAMRASGDFDVVDGPARRFGAKGDGWSLYVRDPDGVVVELRHYGATAAG